MKTSFLKVTEIEAQMVELNMTGRNEHRGGKVCFNGDAFSWGSGVLRKVSGLENIYIAFCNEEFGGRKTCEIYDRKTLKLIKTIFGAGLKDLKNKESFQNELKELNEAA